MGKYFCQLYLSRPYSDLITDVRTVSVFSKQKLEKHHIISLGSVTKIGESIDHLRTDKTNVFNSPLNYVYITDLANNEISDEIKAKAWLPERHILIKGQIQNRVMGLLST